MYKHVQRDPPESRLDGRSRQNRRRGKLTKIDEYHRFGDIHIDIDGVVMKYILVTYDTNVIE